MSEMVVTWLILEILTCGFVVGLNYSDALWARRKFLAILAILGVFLGCFYGAQFGYTGASWWILGSHLYMLVGIMRLYHDGGSEERLRASIPNDQFWLTISSIGGGSLFVTFSGITQSRAMNAYAAVALLCSVAILTTVLYNWWRSRCHKTVKTSTGKLPTVTLAIPARNEAHAIEDTLNHALASTYPKLEILVLDDCSQDATNKIIHSFAHQGVRFIEGSIPNASWQARNQALQRLYEEASGDIIIFSNVDIHLRMDSVSLMVDQIEHDKLDMVSVMPMRRNINWLANFFLLPRNLLLLGWPHLSQRPLAISSLWAVKQDVLRELGGFGSVRSSIDPETRIARQVATSKKYRFLLGYELGITTRKRLNSQIETEVRMLYPRLRRSVARTYWATLIAFVVFLLPIFGIAFVDTSVMVYGLWMIALWLLVAAHIIVAFLSMPQTWSMAIFNYPFVMGLEIILANVSMFKHEFGEVMWKGRNACSAKLQLETINRLPSVEASGSTAKTSH